MGPGRGVRSSREPRRRSRTPRGRRDASRRRAGSPPDSSRPRSRSGLLRGRHAPQRSYFGHCRRSGSRRHERRSDAGSRNGERRRPRALFLMGLPGAGKTTVKREKMRRDRFVNVEPDQLKRFHKRYSSDMGPDTDTEVHRWSVRCAVDAFEEALEDPRRENVILDCAGSNSEWLADRVQSARRAGYRTELLWVDVPVEVALMRNRDRAYARGQFCPERIIIEKAEVMRSSFEAVRKLTDVAERLQNWDPDGDELEKAKLDLHFYPAPRTTPLTVRPGDAAYGESPHGARSPSRSAGSRRTILIGPWKRNDDVMAKKNKRLDWMDRTYRGNRERYVLEEVLAGRETYLERNMFPYHLPPGIEHWTIWSRHDMNDAELYDYIEGWLDSRKPHNVVAWNFDDNSSTRTIDIWHVHIYFQGRGGELPRFCIKSDSRLRDSKAVMPCARRHASREGEKRYDKNETLRTSSSLRSPCSV
eukprot:TRINITY_DN12172_c0_g2_i7.p1 TRINITY_DN12172_c0_g2~~TRINITY_DN12172_c0_g2_i7.p1  ORF type:complete len:474 (-),score=50.21 TRINITY_DN12172_c0_g2_i7:139-1560(-)